MKSIVDKLVSRIDAIEQSSGNTTNIETTTEITDVEGTSEKIPTEGAVVKYVKANQSGSSTSGEIPKHTHKSSDISDRISDVYTYQISNEDIVKFNSEKQRFEFVPLKSIEFTYQIDKDGELFYKIPGPLSYTEESVKQQITNIKSNGGYQVKLDSSGVNLNYSIDSNENFVIGVSQNGDWSNSTITITFNGSLVDINDTTQEIKDLVLTISDITDKNKIPTVNYVVDEIHHTYNSLSKYFSNISPNASVSGTFCILFAKTETRNIDIWIGYGSDKSSISSLIHIFKIAGSQVFYICYELNESYKTENGASSNNVISVGYNGLSYYAIKSREGGDTLTYEIMGSGCIEEPIVVAYSSVQETYPSPSRFNAYTIKESA